MTAQERIFEWCDKLEIALSNVERHCYHRRRALTKSDFAVVTELYKQGMTIEEIAEELDFSYSTVQKFLAQERKKAPASAATEYKSTQI